MVDVPGYKVIKKIGQGGSAEVYLAEQENLQRQVALKFVRSSFTSDPQFAERFQREARIISQLAHPHIIPVYDIGVIGGDYYMSMEYCPGGDLRERASKMTVGELVESMAQVAAALEVAHQKGFVHRDIKPVNILFRASGEAVLTDFGIARRAESVTHMTVTGAMLGTPAYMSPEQLSGSELTSRADLYSLGVTFFEALTNYQPYRSDSLMNVAMQHVNAVIPTLPKASTCFQKLLDSLLAKDPAERMPSAAQFEENLRVFLQSPTIDLSQPLSALWPKSPPPADATTVFQRPDLTVQRSVAKKGGGFGAIAGVIGALGVVVAAAAYVMQDEVVEPPTDVVAINQWQERLAEANRLFDAGQLIEPAGDNALAVFRSILAEDASQVDALSGEEKILSRLLLQTDGMINLQRFDAAEDMADTLEDLWPESDSVERLAAQIKRAREQQASGAQLQAEKEKLARISSLLSRAETAMLNERYTSPSNDNGLEYFQQVLALDPNNASAKSGLNRVASSVLSKAQLAIDDNNFAAAERWIKVAGDVDSRHQQIPVLETALADAKQNYEQRLYMEGAISTLDRKAQRWLRGATENTDSTLNTGKEILSEVQQLSAKHPEEQALVQLERTVVGRLNELNRPVAAPPPPPPSTVQAQPTSSPQFRPPPRDQPRRETQRRPRR